MGHSILEFSNPEKDIATYDPYVKMSSQYDAVTKRVITSLQYKQEAIK